jgi:hypothetical protein
MPRRHSLPRSPHCYVRKGVRHCARVSGRKRCLASRRPLRPQGSAPSRTGQRTQAVSREPATPIPVGHRKMRRSGSRPVIEQHDRHTLWHSQLCSPAGPRTSRCVRTRVGYCARVRGRKRPLVSRSESNHPTGETARGGRRSRAAPSRRCSRCVRTHRVPARRSCCYCRCTDRHGRWLRDCWDRKPRTPGHLAAAQSR